MGGIAYISENDWRCAATAAITVNMLRACIDDGVGTLLYASSACVYPTSLQGADPVPLSESLVYPEAPEGGYGSEKLFSERLCGYAAASSGLQVRIARLFNVYGPLGSWCDGREKAPAAICRKVAEVALGKSEDVLVWGDGAQLRSFLYIDDCVTGLIALAQAGATGPVNLASDQLVNIGELVEMVSEVAGVKVKARYEEAGPTGVRARIPDIGRARQELGWYPSVPLSEGIRVTYRWIYGQMGHLDAVTCGHH